MRKLFVLVLFLAVNALFAGSLAELLQNHPTFIITKFKDPASEKAVMSLNNNGIKYYKIDYEEAQDLISEISAVTKKTNLPIIYINKEFIRDNAHFNEVLKKIGNKK